MQSIKKRNLRMRIESALASSEASDRLSILSAAYPTNFNLVYKHESTVFERRQRNRLKRGKSAIQIQTKISRDAD
jgi:hypothetical protein